MTLTSPPKVAYPARSSPVVVFIVIPQPAPVLPKNPMWVSWRFELTHDTAERTLPPAGNRIEIADLRERVRKLEAIAAGIDF